ncbi:hypothetical protein PW683_01345 [Streptomyces niveus]
MVNSVLGSLLSGGRAADRVSDALPALVVGAVVAVVGALLASWSTSAAGRLEPKVERAANEEYLRAAVRVELEEFERRLEELRDAGEIVDPRLAQIERLKIQNAELKERIVARDEKITRLTEFQTVAISRLAAQHDEIERLRRQIAGSGPVRLLPGAAERIAPFGSCS